jgi:hypothetical protein
MAHLNKFIPIKDDILKGTSIKLRGLEKADIQEKNVDAFLRAFFTSYNNNYDTAYVSNGKVHTVKGRRRSIQDIFMITYYYFPKVSLSKLYIKLSILLNEGVIVSAICSEINKRVYRGKIAYDKGNFFNGPMTDEYGVDFALFDLSGCVFNKVGWGTEYTENNLQIKQV